MEDPQFFTAAGQLERLKLAISDLNRKLAVAPDGVRKSDLGVSVRALVRDTASQLAGVDAGAIPDVPLHSSTLDIRKVVYELDRLLPAASAGAGDAAMLPMDKIAEQLTVAEGVLQQVREKLNLGSR